MRSSTGIILGATSFRKGHDGLLLQPFPNLVGVVLAVEIGKLFASAERFAAGDEDNLVRVGIFANVMADVGTDVEIGARPAGVVVKLVRAAFTRLEKQDVSLCDRFETCERAQGRRTGKHQKQLLGVAVEMIGRVVLSRIEPPQIEIQVPGFHASPFPRDVCKQPETVDSIWIRSEIALFFSNDCCHRLRVMVKPCPDICLPSDKEAAGFMSRSYPKSFTLTTG